MNGKTLVVVPTVTGREDYYTRCVEAYRDTTPPGAVTVKTYRDEPTCGLAWNLGASHALRAGFSYLHLTADDLVPEPGWLEAALEAVNEGATPSALIRNGNGQHESHGAWGVVMPDNAAAQMTRIPFMDVRWWRAIPPIHYFSDNAVTSVMRCQGIPIVAKTGYAFQHHWAQAKRVQAHSEQWFREQHEYEAFSLGMSIQPYT